MVIGSSGSSSRQTCSGPAMCASLTTSTINRDRSSLAQVQRPAGIQAGQQQQVVDEGGHPRRLGLHAPHRVREFGRDRVAAALGEFGVAADRGQRRAQLVAGVGDELPRPRLAGLPGRQRAVDVAAACGSARRRPGRPRCSGRCPPRAPAPTARRRRGPAAARSPWPRCPRPGAAGAACAARSPSPAVRPAPTRSARPHRAPSPASTALTSSPASEMPVITVRAARGPASPADR